MGRYRKIDPRIHNDAKFKALSERGKLLFLTILTHPHMTALGAMRATEAGLCEEMALGVSLKNADCPTDCPSDWPAGVLKSYRNAFQGIIEKGLIKFDPENACLVIPKFLTYNPPESPSVVVAWNQSGDLIPECQLRDELIENTRLFLKGYAKTSFLEAFKLVPNGYSQTARQTAPQTGPQQEQEQEQEIKNPLTPLKGGNDVGDEKTKKRSKRKADRVLPAYSLDFEKFWRRYPNRRGGKEAAWDIWRRREKNGTLPPFPELIAALDKLVKDPEWMKEEGRFVPMVTTFLNKGRWTDADALKSQAPPQNQPDPNCPHCHGRGTVDAEIDGAQGQADCQCRRGNHAS
ncbi:MAG: hypothetical protein M0P73_01315 [Syntrophobacterales bacterium]|jgi:hypothetical protein|nr:hypothetical protein [Syntrophobacterales bacterium]